MTPRVRAILILGALLILAVVVPALLAYQAGVGYGRTLHVDDLEQRVEQLETDVGKLLE